MAKQSKCFKYIQIFNYTHLSTDMHTSTKLDKYKPNVRKNDIRRHIKSPAFHVTVYAQPISMGIIRNVTSRSAIARCVSIASMRDGRFSLRFINSTNTVIFPIDDTTISTLYFRKVGKMKRIFFCENFVNWKFFLLLLVLSVYLPIDEYRQSVAIIENHINWKCNI